VLLAVATQERRELLAAGELVEVAGAQTTGAVFVGAVLEATGSLEHVFEHIAWP
jgi:adenine/guanine phosphoribosyltransferase-like PRPP-binding protein